MRLSHFLTQLVLQPCLLTANAAVAQSYPIKSVRLIVPFAPGGGLDIVARVIAQPLAAMWGQTVIVDNRPGAGGMLRDGDRVKGTSGRLHSDHAQYQSHSDGDTPRTRWRCSKVSRV